ncbi:MAG TPA: hypothetical protein VN158_01935 [Caulobacter sp.]|nr:hypothetical protein [Caulobacter sp.]
MNLNEDTSIEIARIASRGLRTGKLTAEEIKRVCGSALSQFPDHIKAAAEKLDKPRPSPRELLDIANGVKKPKP